MRYEEQLIAKTLDDPKCFDEAALKPEQFFDPNLQKVWKGIQDLQSAGTPLDVFSLGSLLSERHTDSEGFSPLNEVFLSSLLLAAIPGDTAFFATKIRLAWQRKQCIKLIGRMTQLESSGAPVDEIIRAARSGTDGIEQLTGGKLPTLADTFAAEKAKLAVDLATINQGGELHFGLPTGLGIERVVPGGLPLGKVFALYGESGNFKTTTKNNIVWGVAESGAGGVIDFSFEDDNELTTQRFIATHSGINYGQIATRQLDPLELGRARHIDSRALASASRVYLGGDIEPNIDEVVRLSRYYVRHHGVKCVILDYIQLIADEKADLDAAMRKLVRLAKREHISVGIISQVKQEVDFRASQGKDARPRITDMLGSSVFRTAPKLSIGVYRPYKYHKVPAKPTRGGLPNYKRLKDEHPQGEDIYRTLLELWVQKNVLGEPEVCLPLCVDVKTGRMFELQPEIKELLV